MSPSEEDQSLIDQLAEEYPAEREELAESDLDAAPIAEGILEEAETGDRDR